MDIKPSSVHLFHKIGHIDTNGLTLFVSKGGGGSV